jgi:hypothetical protein
MKKRNIFVLIALVVVAATGLVGCVKQYGLRVSTNNLYFGVDPGTKTIEITANCKWTVVKNDDADWYTISAMSGENDGTITITVDALEDSDYRASSFFITVPNGHVRRTIFVSQNKLDFDGMVNKIFGVTELEHWNTDYFGQIIEDSYKFYQYDPYDTATGYTMYFLADGTGVQMDHHNDTAAYYVFNYEYNPVDQILHIAFETVSGAPESYDPNVLTASDSLFRFIHEYKADFWERADMRKIGVFTPQEEAKLRQVVTKRKEGEPIFKID